MLRKIMKYSDLDERKLMDIYSESNYDNTEYFYPDEKDKEKGDCLGCSFDERVEIIPDKNKKTRAEE